MNPPPGTARASRLFLGWDRPALETAARHLMDAAPDGDLSRCLIVLPGGRAARLLLGLLLELTSPAADDAPGTPPGPLLVPPRFCTPGELPDLLLQGDQPETPAGPLARRLAWVAALRSLPARQIEPLIPHPPAADDLHAWWQIAAPLEATHSELAGELIRFADVPGLAAPAGSPPFPEPERWQAAALVQDACERILAAEGLVDPDLRTLQLAALGGTPAEARYGHIVLLGIADLSRAARAALAEAQCPVTAMVFAPEFLGDRFDDLGTVRPEVWSDAIIDLPEPLFAENPADQAQLALETIAALDGRFAPHDITIGIPDDEVVPCIERAAEQASVVQISSEGRKGAAFRTRSASGRPLAQTPPLSLLHAVRDLAHRPTFAAFAALVRHPDVERYLLQSLAPDRQRSAEWWLDSLDCFQAEHIPSQLPSRGEEWTTDDQPTREILTALHAAIRDLLGELVADRARRPLHAWTPPLRALMSRLYAGVELSRTDPTQRGTIEGNIAVRDWVVELERIAAVSPAGRSSQYLPDCTPAEALDMLLDLAGGGAVPDEGDEDTVELLGWLELPLDPAPVLIVTGMNEGIVPSSTVGDSFLPDTLRESLGIPSNRRRFARDLFNLAALAASRQLTLIAGRRSADNTPLAPSRLLFSCSPATAVERIRRFTGDVSTAGRRRIAIRTRPGQVNLFEEMPIIPTEPITSARVTSFRTFLASPYRFYLENVLNLSERDDSALELDPLAYGSLLHDVLERFGRSDASDADDPGRIEQCIFDHLSTLTRQRFGADPGTYIWLQVEFARRRLREFAQLQADRRRAGWLIEHVEWRPAQGPAAMIVDDLPFGLRGKIDRIDRHESGRRWAVLDYKTGDSVNPPDKTHRGRDGWRDLQLPLYRHLAKSLNLPDDPDLVTLGYIAIPKMPGEVRVLEATWTAEDLAEADETARGVIRRIRAADFLHLGDEPPEDGIMAALSGVGFIGGGRRVRLEEGDDA
jgi:ATP-dependent helicase/nuclease subunit B